MGDRLHFSGRRREERFVGGEELVERRGALLDGCAEVVGEFEHERTRDAGEAAARERRGDEHAAEFYVSLLPD